MKKTIPKLLTLVCLLVAIMGLSIVTAHAATVTGTISGGNEYRYHEDKTPVPQWGAFTSTKLKYFTRDDMRSSGRGGSEEDVHMTDTEKKLLQAQHRLEEAQARDRVKERKARTRRLIQEGAILEKVLPEVQTMELSALEDYLMQKLPQHD